MGINSSGNTSTGLIGGANIAYLYSTGDDPLSETARTTKTSFVHDCQQHLYGKSPTGKWRRNWDQERLRPIICCICTNHRPQVTGCRSPTAAPVRAAMMDSFYGVTSSGAPEIWGEGDLSDCYRFRNHEQLYDDADRRRIRGNQYQHF